MLPRGAVQADWNNRHSRPNARKIHDDSLYCVTGDIYIRVNKIGSARDKIRVIDNVRDGIREIDDTRDRIGMEIQKWMLPWSDFANIKIKLDISIIASV